MNEISLPKLIHKVVVPPLKCQGIKTKLVSFIAETIAWHGKGKWIEPWAAGVIIAPAGTVIFLCCSIACRTSFSVIKRRLLTGCAFTLLLTI
ncbi:MAG: hypothetical protein ACE5IR_15095 [bacterium]